MRARGVGVGALVAAAALGVGACGASEPPTFTITASVEVVGDVPLAAAVVPSGALEDGARPYDVVLTATDADGVWIDDVRWTFSTVVDDRHVVATAGHGCGVDLERSSGSLEVVQFCTEEFRVLEARPGAPLRETVRLYEALPGGVSLAAGTYRFEQPIRWRPIVGDDPFGAATGQPRDATVVLTFDIAEDT